jgi:hypothetical protein
VFHRHLSMQDDLGALARKEHHVPEQGVDIAVIFVN